MEDKNIIVVADQTNDSNFSLAGSSMSKVVRLAMELSHEKKRSKQELEDFKQNMIKLNLQLQRVPWTGM